MSDSDSLENAKNNNNSNSNIKNNSNHDSQKIVLRIRATSFKNDVQVTCRLHRDTVADLKQAVRTALHTADNHCYVRLIWKGRLLTPDHAMLSDFKLSHDEVVHAVLAAPGVRGGQQAALARGTTRRYRGTGVNASGRVERTTFHDDFDDEDESDEEDGRERLGFDRLRSSGLSRHEISAIRTYFSRHVERYIHQQVQQHPQQQHHHGRQQQHPLLFSEEPDLVRRRLLQEDAWMATQGPGSEFRLNLGSTSGTSLNANVPSLMSNSFLWTSTGTTNNMPTTTTFGRTMTNNTNNENASLFRASIGTDRDFMWGFLLGFFVGFLMLVWVWMPSVPHKQKLGILTGISMQLGLSLLRTSSIHEDDLDDMLSVEDAVMSAAGGVGGGGGSLMGDEMVVP